MSSGQQMPPWLQEQIAKMQQAQQSLQSILAQKQQVEMEKTESERALEELQKVSDDEHVFKFAGNIMIKSNKQKLIEELEEKKELSKNTNNCFNKTRGTIKIKSARAGKKNTRNVKKSSIWK